MNLPTTLALLAAASLASPVLAGDAVPIPDNDPAGVTIPIQIDTPGAITAITVDLAIVHPWVGDLRIVLESPDGTRVVLLDRPGLGSVGFPGPQGCGGDDIAVTFDDAAADAAQQTCSTTAVPVLTGPARPAEPLAAFTGVEAAGQWTLTLTDLGVDDAGHLTLANLNITSQPACPADLNNDQQLNFFDVTAYLGLFNTQDPAADLAAPSGTFNLFDLFEFLARYNAGCP
jgi:subtilisin-like proprotein convertase family protein